MSYFILYGAFALWVLVDALSRKIGASAALWVLGTVILGPIILPIYLASRPLKQGEVREGGKAWNVLKNFAILWTIAMAIASIAALTRMANISTGLTSDAAKAGAGIGMLLGMGILGAVWFFPTMGAALLGFLLKKSTIVETGPTGPLVGQNATANAAGGWAGLIGFAVLGLIAVAAANVSTRSHRPASTVSSTVSSTSALAAAISEPNSNEWSLDESTDQMDNTPVVVLRKSGSDGAALLIRCAKRKTDAYIDTDSVLDNGSVRLKFDQSAPLRETWGKSTDGKAVFAPDAITFARKLANAKTLLFEFTPYLEGTRTVRFDVTNLGAKLKKVSDTCNWEAVDKSRARAEAASAALRQRLVQYVHLCKDQEVAKWCWSDPNDAIDNFDHGFADTKAEALQDAVESANSGVAFTKK